MITLAMALNGPHEFYHVRLRNRDGSAVRCRRNGACKTWVTRPGEFRLPVKYGLKECFYITHANAAEWSDVDPVGAERRLAEGAAS